MQNIFKKKMQKLRNVQNISHKKVEKIFMKNSDVLNISAEPKIFLKLTSMT